MKVFEVAGKVMGTGEYVLGHDATGSHACYLIYGVLGPGEKGRELRPGKGHEEMVLCVSGTISLSGACDGTLRQGQAVHLQGNEACLAGNPGPGEAVYVISGGHAGQGHH